MIKTIIAAIISYISTSVDEIPVLFMLYTKYRSKGSAKTITLSYYSGTFILTGVSLLGAMGIGFIPERWVIGFFGLVPLILGFKVLLKGDDDRDEEEGVEKAVQKYSSLAIQVLAITLGLGTDDLSVYIPLFTTIRDWQIVVMVFVFAIATGILCGISYKLTSIKKLTEFMERYERYIVGTLFTALGIYIMIDCGTFSHIFGL